MTTTTILLAVAGVLAVVDWLAVALRNTRLEYLAKPATLAALIAAAAVAQFPAGTHWWLVTALGLGLVGDVAILKAAPDRTDGWFLAGLGAFLLGHVAYLVTFLRYGVHGWQLLAGALVAAGLGGLVLPRAVKGAVRERGVDLGLTLLGYSGVLAVTATAAAGTRSTLTAVGGALFVLSDAVLSRERFVSRFTLGRVPAGEVVVAVSYHAAQALIVLGLIHGRWSHL